LATEPHDPFPRRFVIEFKLPKRVYEMALVVIGLLAFLLHRHWMILLLAGIVIAAPRYDYNCSKRVLSVGRPPFWVRVKVNALVAGGMSVVRTTSDDNVETRVRSQFLGLVAAHLRQQDF